MLEFREIKCKGKVHAISTKTKAKTRITSRLQTLFHLKDLNEACFFYFIFFLYFSCSLLADLDYSLSTGSMDLKEFDTKQLILANNKNILSISFFIQIINLFSICNVECDDMAMTFNGKAS